MTPTLAILILIVILIAATAMFTWLLGSFKLGLTVAVTLMGCGFLLAYLRGAMA